MKLSIFLFFVATDKSYFANAVPLESQTGYPRFFEYADDEGNKHVIDLEEEPDQELLTKISRDPANNLYLLYTRRNPGSSQTLVINDANSIRNSNFNANVPTVVIVHGWLSNQNSDLNPVIRDAYLGKSDVNVIVMDWRRLALSGYVTAASGVPDVGRGLGQFISFLSSTSGTPFSNIHLVGFSLGGHLVGNAGRHLSGRLARITALDPAGPLWVYSSDRVNRNDAVYVEAIHTDGNTGVGLGIGKAVGNADFYPNGGTNQPGCLTGICDHNRAWELFAATVSYNHLIARECTSSLQISLNTCRGREFPMGNDDLRKWGEGEFRVDTGRRYPF